MTPSFFIYMNVNFFSGVGGWELGLELAQALGNKKAEHLYIDKSIDIDKISTSIYSENFYKVQPVDINSIYFLDNLNYCYVSFPCNGTSQNGSKLGLKNIHSNLWYKTFDLIKQAKTIFIEQPVGFLSNGAIEVNETLNNHGFQTTCVLLTARMFALPHRRERVFIIASNTHNPHFKYWGKSCWNDNFRKSVQRIVFATRKPEIITRFGSCNNGLPKTRVYNRFNLLDITGTPYREQGRWEKVNAFSKSIVPYQTACILSMYL